MSENRKELFSEKVSAGRRTYFFDVKESSNNERYLVISESRRGASADDDFVHTRVMVFEDHVPAFAEGMEKAVDFLKAK